MWLKSGQPVDAGPAVGLASSPGGPSSPFLGGARPSRPLSSRLLSLTSRSWMLGAVRPQGPRSSGGGFGALWEGGWPGLEVLGGIGGGAQRLGGGVRPARLPAVGLLSARAGDGILSRPWLANRGPPAVGPVLRTLVWSLAWAEWVVEVSVAGGQERTSSAFSFYFLVIVEDWVR